MSFALDWPALLRVGLQELGLEPERFWSLTPCELRLMLRVAEGGAAMSRARLDELTRLYPDQGKGDADDERRGPDRRA